ncbi:hypothetical protein ACFZDK_50125 [Streptomyces sp. NPDC007901]|uniref:hypothetical protein n=1 Tax=Streptomyces sp. NPDC007901 TaxID=3364785 RepID=UPI0036E65E2B
MHEASDSGSRAVEQADACAVPAEAAIRPAAAMARAVVVAVKRRMQGLPELGPGSGGPGG